MNEKMPNYQNGKIYSIRSHQTDEVYIGSTTISLAQRLYVHKSKYRSYKNGEHHYVTSFRILEFNDVYIELVENYPCDSKEQLHRREGEIIRETENCVNAIIAGRTAEEWRKDNREKIKEYYDSNREAILERGKLYREANKDKLQKYQQKYREDNQDKLREYGYTRVTCECGDTSTRQHLKRHKRSAKHQQFEQMCWWT